MHHYFNRLKKRASLLGNHQQKYIRTIEANLDSLMTSLENAGKSEYIHFWKGTPRLSEEMDVVLSVATSKEEKLSFLACYYSLQMLHLNIRSVDVLRLQLTGISKAKRRIPVYKEFMLQTGKDFRKLSAAYMEKLLNIFSDTDINHEYAMLGVGSLAHQDDIDVGVVDDGSESRKELNMIMNRLSREMFKSATELHFYLTEHVGSEFFTASIDEFNELLDDEIQDFIIITEMINAARILGSNRLFKKFMAEVTFRYHFQQNQDNKYHEAYLRGILGEIRSFLFREINQNKLNPKDDALRMISGVIFSGKTIFRIYRVNRWEILAALKRIDSNRKHLYNNLEKSLSFLEIFRHIFQLYVGLEEDIYLDDPVTVQNMQIVAKTLGYQDMGAISAWDHLLIHYHEYVETAKSTAAQLLVDVQEHLKVISSFSVITGMAKDPEPYRSYPGNLAVDFLKQSKFYKGTKYWDDIINELKNEKSHLLQNFINDFKQLKPRLQTKVIKEYGKVFQQALYPAISFVTLVAQKKTTLECKKISEGLIASFLENLTLCNDRVLRLTKVFSWYPDLINDFLSVLNDQQRYQFTLLIDENLWEPQSQKYKELLCSLCEIQNNTSHYFKRFFTRIISKKPIYIQYLKDTNSLDQIAKGMLATVDSLENFEDQKRQLNNYHDLEFFRVGLEALDGVPINKIESDFTEFTDNYIEILFDICKQEVIRRIGKYVPTRDLIAIYAAGGHGREQAFDDDYDLIILLNENDEEIRQYCNKIIVMMNTEIMKRGTMPHYRFADHFGHYITLVDDLDQYFSNNDVNDFIDKSQLLGARMIVGSTKFQKEFENRIIEPHIFEKCSVYMKQMIGEMKSRHEDEGKNQVEELNIKEGIGGLRDIEFLLLMYKVKYRLQEPLNLKLVNRIIEEEAHNKQDLLDLINHRDFLKRLRDLYRLTISAGNVLKTEHLDPVTKILGYHNDEHWDAREKLIQDYNRTTDYSHKIINKLLREFDNC
ncbi:hypothetical protein B6I21_05255 [candidate division KSB1 bacterium 4572_119]|nr:MAG: hypothetical protein B6I21_05255 [candidate division KSB1 bacterium 4572_119]